MIPCSSDFWNHANVSHIQKNIVRSTRMRGKINPKIGIKQKKMSLIAFQMTNTALNGGGRGEN